MKEFFRAFKVNTFLSALISIAIGLALLLKPGQVTNMACRVIACLVLLSGLLAICSYLLEKNRVFKQQLTLVIGIILVLLGLSMLSMPEVFVSLLPLVLAIMVLIHGVQDVMYALNLKHLQGSGTGLTFLFGLLSIALAVLVILNPFEFASGLTMLIGGILIYDGISDLWVVKKLHTANRIFREGIATHFESFEECLEDKMNDVVYTEDAEDVDE